MRLYASVALLLLVSISVFAHVEVRGGARVSGSPDALLAHSSGGNLSSFAGGICLAPGGVAFSCGGNGNAQQGHFSPKPGSMLVRICCHVRVESLAGDDAGDLLNFKVRYRTGTSNSDSTMNLEFPADGTNTVVCSDEASLADATPDPPEAVAPNASAVVVHDAATDTGTALSGSVPASCTALFTS